MRSCSPRRRGHRLDPVKRHSDSLLADVPIPTPKVFRNAVRHRRSLRLHTAGADRLARR